MILLRLGRAALECAGSFAGRGPPSEIGLLSSSNHTEMTSQLTSRWARPWQPRRVGGEWPAAGPAPEAPGGDSRGELLSS